MKFIESFYYRGFSDELSNINFENNIIAINTIRPYSLQDGYKEQKYCKGFLKQSDILFQNSVYIALSSILLQKINKTRIRDLIFSIIL